MARLADDLAGLADRERLMSTGSRAAWVEPDLAPLSAATVLQGRRP